MEDWELEFAPVHTNRPQDEHSDTLAPAPDDPPADPADEPVLAEIDRLQRQKNNWLMTVATLVVSGFLFYGIGVAAWSWKLAALLVPILLFHELGHYLAMLAFRYRNVRMFFIPLFGAAVTGRNYNVPAWKKAVVSLMGPIPGIAIGTALGVVAIFLKHKLLLEAATLMVFINCVNLLPILPLDGGWNLHAILFSRHIWLDTGFRVVTAIVLIGGAFALSEYFLVYLGVAMVLAIPAAYRMATIVARLRQRGVVARSPDSQSVPNETARQIIGEVRTVFPKKMSDKTCARTTLQIFESLNSRPAGWFATLLLGGVHLGSFAFALVASALFFVASRADLGQVLRESADMPQNAYTCGSVSRWSGPRSATGNSPQITLIGNFSDAKKAKLAYGEWTSGLPADAAATLFGQTILLTLPDNAVLRTEWEGKLKPLCTDYRVETKKSLARWTLVCIAPNDHEAEAIEHETSAYLSFAATLVPPWSTSQSPTAAQQKARRTYFKLQNAQSRLSSEHFADFKTAFAEAKQDKAAFAKIQQRILQSHRESVAKALKEVRAEGETAVDLELARIYEAWRLPPEKTKRTPAENQKLFSQLEERMGALAKQDGQVKPGADHDSAWYGRVTQTGLFLRFDLAFRRAGDGLPALAEWLCGRHCLSIKYRLQSRPPQQSNPDADDSEEED